MVPRRDEPPDPNFPLMTTLSLVGLIVVFWERLTTRSGSVIASYVRAYRPSLALARASALGLVPLFLAQLALLALQVRTENDPAINGWMQTLPLPVYDHLTENSAVHPTYCAIAFALALFQTLALAIVYKSQRSFEGRGDRVLIALVVLALAVAALASPAMSTTDPYEYVATGILGLHAYAPSAHDFVGTIYQPFDTLVKLTGVIYGPLWVLVDMVQTHGGTTVYDKIEALRYWNVALLVALLWLLRRAGASGRVVIACALNPAMWYYVVANPHADVQAAVLLVAAYIVARRNLAIPALLLVALAGLVKLPFVFIGGAALYPLANVRSRVASWVAAACITGAVSYVVPGRAYVRDLTTYAAAKIPAVEVLHHIEWMIVIPIGIALVGALLLCRYRAAGFMWLFAQMAPAGAPWYVLWCLPYALTIGRLGLLFVTMPLATELLEADFAPHLDAYATLVAVVGGFIVDATAAARSARRFDLSDGRALDDATAVSAARSGR